MRHVRMLSGSYILRRRSTRRDLRRDLKADVQSEMRIARGSAFHSGHVQIKTKNDSRNVDARAGLRDRSRPEDNKYNSILK